MMQNIITIRYRQNVPGYVMHIMESFYMESLGYRSDKEVRFDELSFIS